MQKSQADGSTFLGGLRDVWMWDGSDWNEVGSTPVPLTLYISDKAAFDPESKEVVAIGDLETTSWDGSAWSQVPNPKNWFGVDVTYVDPTTRRLTALVAFANPDNSLTYRLESWQAATATVFAPGSEHDPAGPLSAQLLELRPLITQFTGIHGSAPVLLIDDVMGELDPKRRAGFLPLLDRARQTSGQVFMTATEENWPRELGGDLQRWQIKDGTVAKL